MKSLNTNRDLMCKILTGFCCSVCPECLAGSAAAVNPDLLFVKQNKNKDPSDWTEPGCGGNSRAKFCLRGLGHSFANEEHLNHVKGPNLCFLLHSKLKVHQLVLEVGFLLSQELQTLSQNFLSESILIN